MKRQSSLSWSPKSIAGAAFVGIGLFVLFENLDGVAAQLSCPLGTNLGEALGVLLYIFMAAASRTLLFQGLVQMLVSFWLLLLVIAVAILLRGSLQGQSWPFFRAQ